MTGETCESIEWSNTPFKNGNQVQCSGAFGTSLNNPKKVTPTRKSCVDPKAKRISRPTPDITPSSLTMIGSATTNTPPPIRAYRTRLMTSRKRSLKNRSGSGSIQQQRSHTTGDSLLISSPPISSSNLEKAIISIQKPHSQSKNNKKDSSPFLCKTINTDQTLNNSIVTPITKQINYTQKSLKTDCVMEDLQSSNNENNENHIIIQKSNVNTPERLSESTNQGLDMQLVPENHQDVTNKSSLDEVTKEERELQRQSHLQDQQRNEDQNKPVRIEDLPKDFEHENQFRYMEKEDCKAEIMTDQALNTLLPLHQQSQPAASNSNEDKIKIEFPNTPVQDEKSCPTAPNSNSWNVPVKNIVPHSLLSIQRELEWKKKVLQNATDNANCDHDEVEWKKTEFLVLTRQWNECYRQMIQVYNNILLLENHEDEEKINDRYINYLEKLESISKKKYNSSSRKECDDTTPKSQVVFAEPAQKISWRENTIMNDDDHFSQKKKCVDVQENLSNTETGAKGEKNAGASNKKTSAGCDVDNDHGSYIHNNEAPQPLENFKLNEGWREKDLSTRPQKNNEFPEHKKRYSNRMRKQEMSPRSRYNTNSINEDSVEENHELKDGKNNIGLPYVDYSEDSSSFSTSREFKGNSERRVRHEHKSKRDYKRRKGVGTVDQLTDFGYEEYPYVHKYKKRSRQRKRGVSHSDSSSSSSLDSSSSTETIKHTRRRFHKKMKSYPSSRRNVHRYSHDYIRMDRERRSISRSRRMRRDHSPSVMRRNNRSRLYEMKEKKRKELDLSFDYESNNVRHRPSRSKHSQRKFRKTNHSSSMEMTSRGKIQRKKSKSIDNHRKLSMSKDGHERTRKSYVSKSIDRNEGNDSRDEYKRSRSRSKDYRQRIEMNPNYERRKSSEKNETNVEGRDAEEKIHRAPQSSTKGQFFEGGAADPLLNTFDSLATISNFGVRSNLSTRKVKKPSKANAPKKKISLGKPVDQVDLNDEVKSLSDNYYDKEDISDMEQSRESFNLSFAQEEPSDKAMKAKSTKEESIEATGNILIDLGRDANVLDEKSTELKKEQSFDLAKSFSKERERKLSPGVSNRRKEPLVQKSGSYLARSLRLQEREILSRVIHDGDESIDSSDDDEELQVQPPPN